MRNSYDDNGFEDELDRIRARKSRSKSRTGRSRTANSRTLRAEEEPWEDDGYDYGDNRKMASGRPSPSRMSGSGRVASGRSTSVKHKRKRRPLRFFMVFLLLCAIAGGAAFSFWKNADSGYWTIAVFGVDSRSGSVSSGLSDVELICRIDRQTGEMKLVSVFRDTYVKISEDGTYHKINEAFNRGGQKQGIYALEENFDLKIDDYAAFNWKAVADAINILGGIDLEITDKEFAYINSFITETVQETGVGSVQLKQSGMNHLDGIQAVAYARLRLMDTDFKRTERQRKVISLAMEKAKQADIGVLNNIVVTVMPQIASSLSPADAIALAKNIGKYHIGETTGFPFAHAPADISGKDCVVAATLESNVIQLHQFLYGIEDYHPSQAVLSINRRIIQDSSIGDVGKDTESGKNIGVGSGGQGGQPAEVPNQTPQPTVSETVPPETVPDNQTEPETEETAVEESESEIQSPSETEEIPETIPIPDIPQMPGPSQIGPGGPGTPGPGGQETGQIPVPEPGEKPTIEEVGPGIH